MPKEMSQAGFEPGVVSPQPALAPLPAHFPTAGLGAPSRAPCPSTPAPKGLGHKATWRRSRGRAWERARGARASGQDVPSRRD